MKNITAAFLLALLSAQMAIPACAHVQPVVTCLGQNVPADVVARVGQDLATENYVDLVEMAVLHGWPLVNCLIDNRVAADPKLTPAAKAFKAQHQRELSGG